MKLLLVILAMCPLLRVVALGSAANELADFLDSGREVPLHLAAMKGDIVTLSSTWTDDTGAYGVVELLRVPIELLDETDLEALEGGKSLTGKIAPSETLFSLTGQPFFVAGTDESLNVSPDEVSKRLLAPATMTLCGNVRARSIVSLTINGKTNPTTKSSYFSSDHAGTDGSSRSLWTSARELADVCDDHDLLLGGCDSPDISCVVTKERAKRVESITCPVGGKCGPLYALLVFFKSSTEYEYRNFAGVCKTIPSVFADQCECRLSAAGMTDFIGWRDEPVPEEQCGEECDGDGGNDPHFKTWEGTHYSYNGKCDLVMAQSDGFGNGAGKDLHIRTAIKDDYSFISNAALKIADDVLEVVNDGSYYVNNKANATLPASIGGYTLTEKSHIHCEGDGADEVCIAGTKLHVAVDETEHIIIRAFKGFLYVKVSPGITDSVGLLGTWGKEGMVARDGETVLTDPNEMGAEWQVMDTDPKLFQTASAPQYPEPCELP